MTNPKNLLNMIATEAAESALEGQVPERPACGQIYIASKASHGNRWRKLRSEGYPINSTWIDECGEGETADWESLWARCIREASDADALVLYREAGEVLKGALVEAGAALASRKPVYAVGVDDMSFTQHPLVHCCDDLNSALMAARSVVERWRIDDTH